LIKSQYKFQLWGSYTVNVFKARLDRFWMDQDVKFDFTADLTGTGDRSVNVISEA